MIGESTYHSLSWQNENNRAYALAWSPDGKYLAAGNADTSVQIFDTATGLLSSVFALAWSPDGRFLASAGGDNTVQVWKSIQ